MAESQSRISLSLNPGYALIICLLAAGTSA